MGLNTNNSRAHCLCLPDLDWEERFMTILVVGLSALITCDEKKFNG